MLGKKPETEALPVVREVYALEFTMACPSCGTLQRDWSQWPLGEETECDRCGVKFRIAKDAKIIQR